ncbi:MAG: hypothetical protein FJW30_26760 [Acidobacteria bacterium]|nr:hypothetical protein [Acidobacteriota bacterium]
MRLRTLVLAAAVLSYGKDGEGEFRIGDTLPELRGEFLNGRTAVLPGAASGRPALLLMGFSYDSRFAVEAWAKRFREAAASCGAATFFEIPMIGGMAQLGKWFIDSGMRRGTPKEDYEHVITVYGGVGPWKDRVGFKDPKAAYLVLTDAGGKIAWRYQGGFDELAFESLRGTCKLLADKN